MPQDPVPHRPPASRCRPCPCRPVGVVGLGQLGGSLAAALVAAGRPVQRLGRRPRRPRRRRRPRACRSPASCPASSSSPSRCRPWRSALDGLTVDPDATVTDLGSVKRPVLETVGGGLRRPVRRRPPDVRHRAVRARRRRPGTVRRRALGAVPGAGHRAAALAAGGRGRAGRRCRGRAGHRRRARRRRRRDQPRPPPAGRRARRRRRRGRPAGARPRRRQLPRRHPGDRQRPRAS